MANTIKIRRSAVQGAVPTTGQLALGELALNTYDGKLYTKKDNGTASVVELSPNGLTDANIASNAEIAVSKLADGAARQLLQTDAAGTGVEWTSNVDIPGTLDVTSAATFDSTISFPLGSAGSPSIYPGTDTNTGFWSPGADIVAVSTGGSERLRIDSSGRVGIGITSPDQQLVVNTSSGHAEIAINANDGTSLSTLRFRSAGVTSAQISASPSLLAFAGSGGTERARFDSSGRLLVGTSSARATRLATTSVTPSVQTLDNGNGGFFIYNNVSSANPATIYAAKSRGNDYTSTVQDGDNLLRISAAGADGTQATEAANITVAVDGTPGSDDMPGRLVFSTTADGASSPTERMRIDSSGNVGIGTSSPGSRLDVKGTLRLSGSTSGYVGLAPAAAAGSTTYTLPSTDGASGQVLSTDGSGTLSWATPASGGGVSDGDKGDITVSASGATWTVDNDAITYAKIQNVSATDRLLGRSTAGAGDIEEITCTAAGRALLDDVDAAAQRTTLGLAIGTNVQGYDADLAAVAALSTTGLINRTGAGTAATVTVPSGNLVGTTATQTLTNKTLTDPAIIGTILEDVFTITDGAAFEVDPANGSIQLITLGANRTPKATNFLAGESVLLMVDDGTAYTLNWTDTTWGTGGVKWVGGAAPTLATTGYTVIELWKVSTQVYGAKVGNA